MHLIPQQTLGGLWHGASLPPVATAAPALDRSPLFRRQNEDEIATCGYIPLSEGAPMRLECPGGDCTTSGAYFGCDRWFHTTCYNSGAPQCKGSLGPLQVCCTIDGSPFCATASKRVSDKWITNFECWGELTGEYVVVDQTKTSGAGSSSTKKSSVASTTESSDAPSSTAEVESSGAEQSSSAPSASEPTSSETTGSDSASGGSGSSNNESTKDEGSGAPVGAIVGGVVGGIALIAMIAFGVWFVRFQKRKEARKLEGNQPFGDQSSTHQFSSDTKYQTGGYVPMADYPSTNPSPKPPSTGYLAEAPSENFHRVEAPNENYHRAELS